VSHKGALTARVCVCVCLISHACNAAVGSWYLAQTEPRPLLPTALVVVVNLCAFILWKTFAIISQNVFVVNWNARKTFCGWRLKTWEKPCTLTRTQTPTHTHMWNETNTFAGQSHFLNTLRTLEKMGTIKCNFPEC